MPTLPRVSTTDMEVTSIRLDKALKEQLKVLAGDRGYQALIRDILWQYVQQQSNDYQPTIAPEEIRATLAATAQHTETCALTGAAIPAHSPMLLGWTRHNTWVPLAPGSLSAAR